MHENLLKILLQQTQISEKEIGLCTKYFEPVIFLKNRIVEEEGKIPQYLYFMVYGYMRLFHYNENEITSHINCPLGFITSYFSFINQTKSTENVECITECELLRINKSDLDLITSQSSTLKDFSIWVFQQSIFYNENRSKELATLSAEQRYQMLSTYFP
jgi:CRP-like cAMP-binding protein